MPRPREEVPRTTRTLLTSSLLMADINMLMNIKMEHLIKTKAVWIEGTLESRDYNKHFNGPLMEAPDVAMQECSRIRTNV